MKVKEVISKLQAFLDEDRKTRYFKNIYLQGYGITDYTIDCVYYRCGEVVLQSNETDQGNWSLIIPYIIHCLKFFNEETDVCVSISDEDLDWSVYDIDSIGSDGDNLNVYITYR